MRDYAADVGKSLDTIDGVVDHGIVMKNRLVSSKESKSTGKSVFIIYTSLLALQMQGGDRRRDRSKNC